MRQSRRRLEAIVQCVTVLAATAAVSRVSTAATAPVPEYVLQASLSTAAPQIEGTLSVAFTNDSRRTLHEAVFFLFANRFAAPDAGINDFNRPFVYPQEEFDAGSMEVVEEDTRGRRVPEPVPHPGMPDGRVVRVPIEPLAPGASRKIRLQFRTVVPHRFGSFGAFDGQLTLNGGWYPHLAALDAEGTWQLDAPPPLANFQVSLARPSDIEIVLNGQHFPHGAPVVAGSVAAVHYLSLVAAPALLRSEATADGSRIVLLRRPARRTSRISPEPDADEIMLATLRDMVSRRPADVPQPATEIVVVEAPLRLQLTAPGEGMVLVSDRSLKVHWLLRPFHELQLAQAVYAELLRTALVTREHDNDYPWASEGLAHVLAARFVAQARPGTRSVQDWIDLFNIFAIVDRFETSPKIPFVSAFFEPAQSTDDLHEQISTFNNDLPPGHVIMGKLRQRIGDAPFQTLVDRCLHTDLPFRECAARQTAEDLGPFFAQWLQPYPAINYDVASVRLNERRDDSFRSAVTVRRRADREIHEPVDVRLRSIGGRTVDLRWDGSGDQARLEAVTPQRMCQAIIDPNRKLIETTRADNASPPTPQIVLDTAEVEISSTEFGISGLIVGRGRYDYRKDLAVAGFFTNRSIGVDAGARYHWGVQNDPTLYRNNIYLFYGAQALDGSFKDERHPAVRTRGHVNGLGVRYDYTNVFSYDNPTEEVHLRLFADWNDRALGSDFNYVDGGASLVLTHPLWTHRTILAGELSNSFSEPLGAGVVPNQGLFSLGGSRSIRGIGAEDELGRNIFLLRGELRQMVYPELDLNFLDLLVLRRAQLRFFVDSGQVSNSAGAIYDPSGYAVGVGTGFAAVYDFLGFFPSIAYIEVATRVDRPSNAGEVQFLFGTRQAF